MKKYFYINGDKKLGPFTFDELKNQNLTRDTKVWFHGLVNWAKLSEIEELNSITKSIPPPLKISKLEDVRITNESKETHKKGNNLFQVLKNKAKGVSSTIIFTSIVTMLMITLISSVIIKNYKENQLYLNISESSFDADEDFDFYVEKFYRDIEVYGIYPKKPKKTIIKFSKLDQLDDATHIHGISYGVNNDDIIEIYINPSTWKKFNKPMRYFLMYHELAHDVLNVYDLDNLSMYEGKLMFPALESYESKSMDDFIESSHALFEEISGVKN